MQLLPINVPITWGTLIACLIGITSITIRTYYVMWRAELINARTALIGIAWLIGAYAVMLILVSRGNLSPSMAVFQIGWLLAVILLYGAIMLFAPRADHRLIGFYSVQVVGWTALWGAIVVFLGAQTIA